MQGAPQNSLVVAVFRIAAEDRSDLQVPRVVMAASIPGLIETDWLDAAGPQEDAILMTCWEDRAALRARRGQPEPLGALPDVVFETRAEGNLCNVLPSERFLARHLTDTEATYVAGATREGTISTCNRAFTRLVRRQRPALREMTLWPLLVDTDAATLRDTIRGKDAGRANLQLNFVDAASVPHTLSCRVRWRPDGFSLLGERIARRESDFEQEVLRLNNELAVFSRENARKSKALEKAMRKLREAQALLVHTEKMASLGQMTAGVAHEINNPLAFVVSNNTVLQRDFEGLLGLINVIGDALPEIEGQLPGLHTQIAKKAREMRLDRLVQSVPRKLTANGEGLERIRKLVLDLRTFSRLDEAARKEVDLADSIRATLRFLDPLLTEHGVGLELQFAQMPPTPCDPGALNQVVSNLVTNSVQASSRGQVVRVQTFVEGSWHVVRVIDEGAGISKENLDKVFNPFFTTKPVGVGTGLGLSIAHQVVKAHGGKLEIDSAEGRGTTISTFIPATTEAEG